MAASASSCSTGTVRTWRTTFLTLRDETLHLNESIGSLLHRLIFSLSPNLVSASPLLPPDEVTSDLLFLLELAASSSQDQLPVLPGISQLMHDVCRGQRFPLEFNSSSWTSLIGSFSILLHTALINPSADTVRPVLQCLETLRHLVNVNKQKFSLSDDLQLVKFLLHVIENSHTQLFSPSYPCQRSQTVTRKGPSSYVALCEIHTVAFMMLGESFPRLGSSFPTDTWQVAIEVLRKVTDALTSKRLLAGDYTMSRLYSSLFNCLHMALVDPKGSLVDHVSGFVATLRLFFVYGLSGRPKFIGQANGLKEKEPDMMSLKLKPGESRGKVQAPYRPPHLRKRESLKSNQSSCFSDGEYSTPDLTSSDSDCSDSDISVKENDDTQSFKVRIAAIVCIQDLCQADPKSFTSQWTMLLPTHDVLQPRKSEATLMTCLLFDPYMKARITSASALATMLDGPAPVFLQIAEYNESTKWGSFMALSSSLGCILMQLHTGILYLIEHETHSRLLASLFKILVLLISSTPYSRMPGELLPTVMASLLAKIENGSTFKSDRAGQLAAIINCFTAALSTSPSSPQVKTMLLEEKPTDVLGFEMKSGLLCTLFWYADQPTSPPTCCEALQALRAMAHNYPDVTFGCWEQILALVFKISGLVTVDIPQRTWKEHIGDNAGFIGEKIITSAIKVLDECLRALSGFKGTEEFMDDKFWDTPFTSDCIRAKKVSSAPVFESGSSTDTESESRICQSGIECWSKTIEKLIPRFLRCTSVMVRTATVTCFAGITSSVFFSITKEKQEFIVSSLIDAALKDGVPSVRSAACRAIGVISYFPLVPQSSEMLEKFIHAVEINSHDNLVSVRITASWALANICESLRHYMAAFTSKMTRDSIVSTALMAMLAECALRLTKDGDKIKSNAVRALGNLSRFVECTSSSDMHDKLRESLVLSTDNITQLPPTSKLQSGHISHSLNPNLLGGPYLVEEIVQAFLSCVTTGNVKVQWNVCYALSHLFLNETLILQDMDWAPSVFSILLLLLRDSSNFKIRIQAAAALAVPASAIDYGKSFPDVVQGLTNILENLSCVQISAPASFKYKVALEKQVTSTMLHVLGLSSSRDHELLKDFLVKKAPFLEDWFKALCSSWEETNTLEEGENHTQKQKKHMISKAIRSLMEIYENSRHYAITQKFEKLSRSMQ